MYRNLAMVPRLVFGRGAIDQLDAILGDRRTDGGHAVFVVDHVFRNGHALPGRLPVRENDRIVWADTREEPTTAAVDEIVADIRARGRGLPDAVVGVGGGSVMDLAKATSVLLTNPGSAAEYQGWDLPDNPAVYHAAAPTLAGTGAEVSRTAVLIGPERKLGVNSDYTVFDQVVLDPDLLEGVPPAQRFHTGMDCYIHCVESLSGTFINAFSRACAEKAVDLCREIFLDDPEDADDRLMMASWFGGLSIAYSQVGVCHALSYGLSFVLGIHHGIGNCIAFDQLEEFYPEGVAEFRTMMTRHGIQLPRGVVAELDEDRLDRMTTVALGLAPLWENALGPDWRRKMPPERIRELYRRI